jgi:Flp pilus assembly pilin Flp
MKFFTRLEKQLAQQRGQTMTEYALVIAGVAVVVLFTGYQQVGQIIVTFVNQVVALF